MTLLEIKKAIQTGDFNLSELNELTAWVNSVKVQNAKAEISVGDEVFVVQKTKRTKGIVEKGMEIEWQKRAFTSEYIPDAGKPQTDNFDHWAENGWDNSIQDIKKLKDGNY